MMPGKLEAKDVEKILLKVFLIHRRVLLDQWRQEQGYPWESNLLQPLPPDSSVVAERPIVLVVVANPVGSVASNSTWRQPVQPDVVVRSKKVPHCRRYSVRRFGIRLTWDFCGRATSHREAVEDWISLRSLLLVAFVEHAASVELAVAVASAVAAGAAVFVVLFLMRKILMILREATMIFGYVLWMEVDVHYRLIWCVSNLLVDYHNVRFFGVVIPPSSIH